MAIFRFEKRGTSNWWHWNGTTQILNFSNWEIVFDEVSQSVNLQQLNGANVPITQVPIADVRVKNLSGSDETFVTVELLRVRLVALGYNPLVTSGGGGSQNLAEVLAIGGREIKYHDTTTGNYTLIASDKNKIIILLEDTEIDIIVPASGFSDGDSVIIQNPNGTATANFDISGVQTYSDFSPLLPSYSVVITYALTVDAYGASYSTNGLSSSGIPDAPNDENAYVRSGLAWVIGYTKSAIDTLLGTKTGIIAKKATDSTAVTGVTTEQILESISIPANTLAVGDILRVFWSFNKSVSTGTTTIRLRTNTSNSISGSSIISTSGALASGTRGLSFQRHLNLRTGVLEHVNNTTVGAYENAGQSSVRGTTTFDPTIDNWFLITCQNNTQSTDSVVCSNYTFEKI